MSKTYVPVCDTVSHEEGVDVLQLDLKIVKKLDKHDLEEKKQSKQIKD